MTQLPSLEAAKAQARYIRKDLATQGATYPIPQRWNWWTKATATKIGTPFTPPSAIKHARQSFWAR